MLCFAVNMRADATPVSAAHVRAHALRQPQHLHRRWLRPTAWLGDDGQQRVAGVDGQRRHQKANLAPCDGGQALRRALR